MACFAGQRHPQPGAWWTGRRSGRRSSDSAFKPVGSRPSSSEADSCCGLVLFAPRLLVPPASDASLRDVTDAAKRHELRDSRLKLQNDVRTTLLQGVGGLAVLIGAFFTYRQVQTSRRQLEIAQHGQVTERFTRAIDQLGHENLDVRLGGIYTLERIANDSAQDRTIVTEILTAFIRGHAPWPPSRPGLADCLRWPRACASADADGLDRWGVDVRTREPWRGHYPRVAWSGTPCC
jgi:hypothetical protein